MNHDEHDGHDRHWHGMRLPSALTQRAEEVMSQTQRVDLIVENAIVVELKAVSRVEEVHRAQLISYLRSTGLKGGLLNNFRVPVLHAGLKRIVL